MASHKAVNEKKLLRLWMTVWSVCMVSEVGGVSFRCWSVSQESSFLSLFFPCFLFECWYFFNVLAHLRADRETDKQTNIVSFWSIRYAISSSISGKIWFFNILLVTCPSLNTSFKTKKRNIIYLYNHNILHYSWQHWHYNMKKAHTNKNIRIIQHRSE